MALRRYAEEIKQQVSLKAGLKLGCEILMKTNICDFNALKTPSLLSKLKLLYNLANLDRGDFLNITIGNHEISIAISQKYYEKILSFLEGEKLLLKQKDLVALTLIFTGDFIHTPGITFQVMRVLAWENINIYEIISTLTELTLVIENKDSIKGYEVLQNFIERLEHGS